jgi:redox-sensitive bicupin YhaK (pirin superfamily)
MLLDRKILAVATKREVLEGAGELVGRVLPQPRLGLEPLDPFLLMDHFSLRPDGPGFPEHPHRGFEILTYIRRGWGRHRDNLGNEATVRAGGLMCLNAGRGLWHSEAGGAEQGQRVEGLQFWVNLPQAAKRQAPSFQQAEDAELPRRLQDDGRTVVKVLVGPDSPVRVQRPMVYLDVSVAPGGRFVWELSPAWQGFVYLLDGEAGLGAEQVRAVRDQVAVLGQGGGLEVRNQAAAPLTFVLAAGEPIREPVVWNGPFVD